jgi:PAS domain S-box-containing protein
MKKKILLALGIFSVIFVAGGIYIIATIEISTSQLDHLIMLHQVEILREHLLINLRSVQSDLLLLKTRHKRDIDTIIANVKGMDGVVESCFDCHHSEDVRKRLTDLRSRVDEYKHSLNRVLTLRADRNRMMEEEDRAFANAERLIVDVNTMVHMAALKLSDETQSALKNVADSKILIYILVTAGPIIAISFGFIFIRALTNPLNALLRATRELRGGDLDHRVEGFKDEFGEVAASFNEMATSLQEYIHKVQESERRYRLLFESAGDAIFVVEAEGEKPGDIVEANLAAAKMHGYDITELLGLNLIKDLDTSDAAKGAPERIQRILNGEWIKAEIPHQQKDGTVFPVEASAGLLEYMGRKYILAIDRDISDRKKMENEILQAKNDWEETFDTIPDMITIHDQDFNIIRANKAAKKFLGLPPLEVAKAKCYEYFHGKECPPDDCPTCECLKTKQAASFEFFEPHFDRFFEVRAMPQFDNKNEMVGLIHVVRDITERKKVDETLQRAEQMRLVGEWAAGLAHEIKNPLAGIKVSVQVLTEEPNISEEDRGIALRAIDEIRRIELLIKSLLNFAKPPQPKLVVTDVNDILDKTLSFSLKHPSLTSDQTTAINIATDFDENLPETLADPMQLRQAFLNLMLNAIQAMPDGGILAVKTRYRKKPPSIQITISDTGEGMDKHTMDNIFQPFFTTKPKGTGLGLAITKRLIEQLGGEIHAESDPGNGTAFNILLDLEQGQGEQVT